MRTKFNLIILILFLFPLAAAAQDLPACTIPIADIDGAATHLRNIQDRIDNLVELFADIQADGLSDDASYELMYWAVMADNSIALNKEMIYPECSEYVVMNQAFADIIADMYAASTQTALLRENRLNGDQTERVLLLLQDRSENIRSNIALWDATYQLAKDI